MTDDTADIDVADLESIPFSGRVRAIFDASCENVAQLDDRPEALAISQRHTSVLAAESERELAAALAAIEYTKAGRHLDTPRQREALNRVEARVKLQLDKLETPPKCPECGGRNVVKAGKTEENCEDCAIFFVPGETDGVDRGEGIETDGGRPTQASFGDFDGDDDDASSSEEHVRETEPEPVAIDPTDWDVSDHAGEEVLLITGITRVMSAPETVTGEISSSGKTIAAAKPHRDDSTVRLDTETILSGDAEHRDSRYFELYTPARLEKNQRSNHAPGPQAGANHVVDPDEAAAPTHWPAIEQAADVPAVCPNCDEAAAPFQVEHVQSPRCENCGELLEELEDDDNGDGADATDEPSAVNMQTWARGGVIETPDASLLITRLSRAAGYDTVLRAQAVDEQTREYLLRAPSDEGVLYVERNGQPSGVVFADELPNYSDDEAAYVGVDEERLRRWFRAEYHNDDGDDDDGRDGGIDHDGDGGPGGSGSGSSDGQESDGDQKADAEEREEPPKILADGGQWDVSDPVSLDRFLPLDMANNITDQRVKERITWVDGFGRAYADALEQTESETADIDRGEGIKTDGGRAELLTWIHPDDAPEDALDARQLVELKEGVRAAIDGGGPSILTAPGDLSRDRWSHAGVGVSIYMHSSGVVVLESGEDRIVTDATTLDTIRDGGAGFFIDPGPAVVASDDVEQLSEGNR